MKYQQETLPGMPQGAPQGHQNGQEYHARWFVLKNPDNGRIYAINPVTGDHGFFAFSITENDVMFYAGILVAGEMARRTPGAEIYQLSRQEMESAGLF